MVQKMFIFIAVLYMSTEYVSTGNIPSFVHLCRRNDPEFSKCFNNTLYELLPRMINGIPEMNIGPIEPLSFTTVKINTGVGTSVNLEVVLSNGTINGIKNMKMDKLIGNVDTVRFSVIMRLPYIRLQGNYKIQGKILLFEILSSGHCDINATDLVMHIDWYGDHYTENGKQHIRFKKIEYNKLDLHNLVVKLEDSNKDNQPFMENVNKAINYNIDVLVSELDVLIKDTVGEVSLEFFNSVYRHFPEEQLFPVV